METKRREAKERDTTKTDSLDPRCTSIGRKQMAACMRCYPNTVVTVYPRYQAVRAKIGN